MAKSQKGSAFERDFCKRLSLWWTTGRSDAVFWRSTTSGARATTRAKTGKKTAGQHGDITFTDPCGAMLIDLLTIELKRGYTGSSIHDILDKPNSAVRQQWEKFIEQTVKSHELSGSFGWLIVSRRDRRSEVVMMPQFLYSTFRELGCFRPHPTPSMFICINDDYTDEEADSPMRLFCVRSDDFFDCVSPRVIRELFRIA
jgi:hypothetical protein